MWALRVSTSFGDAMRRVIDLGGDTDTVAAVTGGSVGAVYGIPGIPMCWTSAVHGTLPGFPTPVTHLGQLHELSEALDDGPAAPHLRHGGIGVGPTETGMVTCSREPSGSIASTNGVPRSTRRPDNCTVLQE